MFSYDDLNCNSHGDIGPIVFSFADYLVSSSDVPWQCHAGRSCEWKRRSCHSLSALRQQDESNQTGEDSIFRGAIDDPFTTFWFHRRFRFISPVDSALTTICLQSSRNWGLDPTHRRHRHSNDVEVTLNATHVYTKIYKYVAYWEIMIIYNWIIVMDVFVDPLGIRPPINLISQHENDIIIQRQDVWFPCR